MKRQFIGIEIGEQALEKCVPRLRNVINGEQTGISRLESWQGGSGFTFYRLGEEVFDEDGRLRPGMPFATLAAHIWFSETGAPLPQSGGAGGGPVANSPFLGIHDGRGYALLYNGILGDKRPNGGNVLTSATLALIRDGAAGFAGPLTIYGEASRLSEPRLKAESVTFKQTPYDVKAR
jgi:adenine-specific DNA-methyltransferase